MQREPRVSPRVCAAPRGRASFWGATPGARLHDAIANPNTEYRDMTDATNLPPLYSAIDLLDRVQHKTLRVRGLKNAKFTARQHFFPLTGAEFAEAGRCYPVVFLRADGRVGAMAITGATPGVNAALGEDERWRPGLYVPAYVRRYPFILVRVGDELKIGLDPNAPHLSSVEGEPIFDANGDTGGLARIQSFCAAYDAAWRDTEAFVAALEEKGLLAPATTTFSSGAEEATARVGGFEIIDQARLEALDPAILADWLRRGWLALIEAHRASLRRWADIRAAGMPAAA